MQRLALASLWLAACYQPVVPTGAPCTTNDDCPVEQVCSGGTCNAPGTVSGVVPPDRDRDGIVNDEDNCPDVANPDQANEDGDRFGDVCDPCPIAADDAPLDTDGDGVADACDPNPAVAGDRIALFEGFRGGVPSWTRSTNWAVVGDSLVGSSAVDRDEWLIVPASASDRIAVLAKVTVEAITGTNTWHEVGVMTPYDVIANHGIGCHLVQPGDPTTDRFAALADDFQTGELARSNLVWATVTPYVLAALRSGTSYQCVVKTGGASTAAVGSSSSTASPLLIGVRVHAMTAAIDWVLVIGSS